jgi:hypothetical protein
MMPPVASSSGRDNRPNCGRLHIRTGRQRTTRSLSPLANHNDPKLAAKEWQRLPGHSRKND